MDTVAAKARTFFHSAARRLSTVSPVTYLKRRNQTEQELKKALDVLRGIGECSADAIYAKDHESRIIFANPATLTIFGKPLYEVIGRSNRDWHEDREQAERVIANDREVIRSGAVQVFEETYDAAHAGTRIYRSSKAPLRDSTGAVIGIVGVSSDITELKNTEAQLRLLTEQLEIRVRAEVAKREAANAQLIQAQRMEALGQLAAGVAHDFNNVLQAIQGGAQLVERRSEDPDAVRKISAMIHQATKRGASVTARLLTFARQSELRSELIDVALFLSEMRKLFVHTLRDDIVVQVEATTDLPPLQADRAQLETVLINFATNSRDAMPKGGELTLTARSVWITDKSSHDVKLRPGQYVQITIADNGIGMNAATLARASEPFFTTKGVGRGTGLGLAMARGFAEQSGGALIIDSRVGFGTSVHLWLPCVAGPASSQTHQQPDPIRSRALRILVVDDNSLVLEVLCAQLREFGHTVAAASDGLEALNKITISDTFDLLITDFAMQKMNGVALIHEAQACVPELCSILLTGYMDNDAIQNWGLGPNRKVIVMRKPVSSLELATGIAKLLPN